MRINLLVLGSKEPSGFIGVALELVNSCFPTCLPDQVFPENFATRSKQTNE